MKIFPMILASAALLAAPLAASAQGFNGGHGGERSPAPSAARGGFQGRPAFDGRPGVEGRPGYEGRPVFEGRAGFYGRPYDRGYYSSRWAIGAILPSLYWDAYLSDPYDYGLAAAPFGYHWVYTGDEALLIQNRTGVVVQVAPL